MFLNGRLYPSMSIRLRSNNFLSFRDPPAHFSGCKAESRTVWPLQGPQPRRESRYRKHSTVTVLGFRVTAQWCVNLHWNGGTERASTWVGSQVSARNSSSFVCLFVWLVGCCIENCSLFVLETIQNTYCAVSILRVPVVRVPVSFKPLRISVLGIEFSWDVCVFTCLGGGTVLPFSRFSVWSSFLNEREIYVLQCHLTGSALLFYLLQYTVLL